ncbi:LRFN1 [Branchiostoma lanceolatum]|uniref:LRFN1 protein n=1 Tax=Branchiostoma lanceolatum TaxID=7740 RepID=A0A8J9YR07_BRALA|nr:LRFN1 [Branchiostoma lanceolatum]
MPLLHQIFSDYLFLDLNDVVVEKSPCLNFDGNELRAVTGYLPFSAWVDKLVLSNNQISVVEEASLAFMDKLTILDLSRNRLQTFPWNVSLTNMTSLSLAYNQLTSLPAEATLGTTLHILNLANNNLTSVPEQLFFKHVPMVALKGNPWHCNCLLTLLTEWLLLHYQPDTTCKPAYITDVAGNGSVGSEPPSQCAGSAMNVTSMFDPPSCFTPARLMNQCVVGGNFCKRACHGNAVPYDVIPSLTNQLMVSAGEEVVLKCVSPTDKDESLAGWLHPRAGLVDDETNPSQSFCTDEHGNLVIKNIRADDAGVYACALRHAHVKSYVNVTVLDNFEPETRIWDPGFTNNVTTPTDDVQVTSSPSPPQPTSSTHPPNDTENSPRFHSNVTTDTPTDEPTIPNRSEREGVIELTVSDVSSSTAMIKWMTPAFLRGSFLRLFYHEEQEGETGRVWMDMEQRSVLIKPGFRRQELQNLQPSTYYVVCISAHTLPEQDECVLFRTEASGVNPLYFTIVPVPLIGLLALGCYVKIRNKRRQIRRQYLNPFQTLAENTWNSLSLFGPGVDATSLRRSADEDHIYAVPGDDVYDDVGDVMLDPGSSVAKYHPRHSYPCREAQEHIYARACTVKKTVREGRPYTKMNAAGKVLLRRGSGSYEKACSVTLPMLKIPLPKTDTNETGSVSLNSVYASACSVRSSYGDPSFSPQSVISQEDGARGKTPSRDVYVSPVDVRASDARGARVQGIEDSPTSQDHLFANVSTESCEMVLESSSDDMEQEAYLQVDKSFHNFARSNKNKLFEKRPASW